jgi:hypothetical protein
VYFKRLANAKKHFPESARLGIMSLVDSLAVKASELCQPEKNSATPHLFTTVGKVRNHPSEVVKPY